jgi:uncharacterized protein (UPF0335 family)
MKDDETGMGIGDEGARIGELDNEDLSIEELLDIEEKIEERIEGLERESEALSADLYGEKMTMEQRKDNLSRKERIAEALEELEEQKRLVRSRLKSQGYDVGEGKGD